MDATYQRIPSLQLFPLPPLPQTPFYSQVTYSTEKRKENGIQKHSRKQPTLFFFNCTPPLSFAVDVVHSQAAVHFCDGQGINTIKPTVFQIEKQKETLLWFNKKEASCLMHKWMLPLCFLSLRICINSTTFSISAYWENKHCYSVVQYSLEKRKGISKEIR